jgi:hypothetical protein
MFGDNLAMLARMADGGTSVAPIAGELGPVAANDRLRRAL